ncbi:autotransporter outer membrane beta-barrel domain-containing protein, partial [Glaesserella parasuis]|uniref:autotransporter outer membrane beta-barrel domain-containing protein n=1 Tax=Glaesserella parasuis TaxID=738 RepID=UPI001F28B4B4
QTGFDKQSHLSNAELFTGVTVTHTSTDIEGKIGSTNGDVKSIGAGVYATALFDNGFYLDTIAKYVKNNQKKKKKQQKKKKKKKKNSDR